MNLTAKSASEYINLGWSLVAIRSGTKIPKLNGWQKRGQEASHWDNNPNDGLGLLHTLSGTCVIDVDHTDHTRTALAAVGVDLDALFRNSVAISGNPKRGKLLFKVPQGATLTTRKLQWPDVGVIFELRAGLSQDILPPSIHPDTGQPYKWHGIAYQDITDLPQEILELWQSWDQIKYHLENVCPWQTDRPKPAPVRNNPKAGVFDGVSVIEAFNAQTTVTEQLEAAGYQPQGRNRWLSPLATSKMAGAVAFKDGRGFSHHASDPFDGKSFDAFEIYVQFSHAGDFSKAVREAAIRLEISDLPDDTSEQDMEHVQHGRGVWESWLANSKEITEHIAEENIEYLDGVPKHLLSIDGVLGEVVDYYNSTAKRPQPQFAVQTALAFGSVVLGRNWVTDSDNYTAMYFLNVAKSSTGKEHANTVLGRLLTESDLGHKMVASGYTSPSAVFSALIDQPVHISVIDEFGMVLKSNSTGVNTHKADVETILMTLSGILSEKLMPQRYATQFLKKDQKDQLKKAIVRPSLSLMCMTTPTTLYDVLSSKYINSGFIGRFIIVESKIPRTARNRVKRGTSIPESIIEWARDHTPSGDLGEGSHDIAVEPTEVHFSTGAWDVIDTFENEAVTLMNFWDKFGMDTLFGRSCEMSMRVALIVARSKGEDEISAETMQWSVDYIRFYAVRNAENLKGELTDGPFEEVCNRIFALIYKSGLRGMTEALLSNRCRSFKNLEPRRRDDVFKTLKIDKGIHATSMGEKVRWFSAEPDIDT